MAPVHNRWDAQLTSQTGTSVPWEPYRLLDSSGEPMVAVAAYFGELQAAGRPAATRDGTSSPATSSVAATKEKLAQTDVTLQRREAAVELGMPAFPNVVARTVTT